jgi:hypothetical protein
MKTNQNISRKSITQRMAGGTLVLALIFFFSIVKTSQAQNNGQCYYSTKVGLSWSCSLTPYSLFGVTVGFSCSGGTCAYSSQTTYTCANCSFLESLCNCSVTSTSMPVTIYAGSCSGSFLIPGDQTDCSCTWNGITPSATPTAVGVFTAGVSNQSVCLDN